MSAEEQKVEDLPNTGEAAVAPLDYQERDWFLQVLVQGANNNGLEMGITLSVQGATISGTLIGYGTYFKEFGKLLGGTAKAGDASGVEQTFASMGDPDGPIKYDTKALPRFVHLRDARVFTPGGVLPANEGVLWRGRLADVNGFNLGVLRREG